MRCIAAFATRPISSVRREPRESYLSVERLIDVARKSGAECVHPGYGFLSESGDFADACAQAGVEFVGPPAAAIRAMGLKDRAKALMEKAGVPIVPGYHGERQDAKFLKEQAERDRLSGADQTGRGRRRSRTAPDRQSSRLRG